MKTYLYQIMTDQKKGVIAFSVKILLLLMSFVFEMIVFVRNLFYDKRILKARKLSVPVISIGNITVGGSGKTPLAEEIARTLMRQGRKVGILTRGYMPRNSDAVESDEVRMLKRHLPELEIVAGKNRYGAAQEFLRDRSVDVFVMDDGFQHRKIFRDLDIVCVDATNPFGNGHLLPRGILREPVSSLKRADVIVLTRSDQAGGDDGLEDILKKQFPEKFIARAVHEPVYFVDMISKETVGLDFVKGKKVFGFCSIGNPQAFKDALAGLGADVVCRAFEDHYVYQEKDGKQIIAEAEECGSSVLITTEKDAVKCGGSGVFSSAGVTVLSLQIRISVVQGKEEFFERIFSVLHR